ncbi:hypothetical protein LTS10_010214 [Elasticomyces elasticus]|nr:hypothetical protein LTS10_010214 [Elasticomyces elasticus]
MAKVELRNAYALDSRTINDEGLNKEISQLQERARKLEESEIALMSTCLLCICVSNAEFEARAEKRKCESLGKDFEREKAAAGKLLAQLATAEVRIMNMEHTKGSLKEELNVMAEKFVVLEQQMHDVVAGITALVEPDLSDWDAGTVAINVARGVQVEQPFGEDLDIRALQWDLSVRPTPFAEDNPVDAWSLRRLWLRTCKTTTTEVILDHVEVCVAWLSRSEAVRGHHRRDALAAAKQYYRSSNEDPDTLVMARLLEVTVRAKISRVELWPVWQTWRLGSSTQESSPLLLGLGDWLEEQISNRTSVRTMLHCAAVHINAMDTVTDVNNGRTLTPYDGRFLIVDAVNRFSTEFF